VSAIHIGDTGLFVAIGDTKNRRYHAVRTFAYRNDIGFVLPERVYDELTANRSADRTPPIDAAIDDGWVRVADPLNYTIPLVSRVMDGVQRYIANADSRPEDEIERADAALAGVAAQAFSEGTANEAYVYTTDHDAGEGIETIFASEGYGDSITYINGFRFVNDLVD